MTSRDFAFWLQGFLEIRGNGEGMTPEQVACVQKHLALVFVHEIDPSMPSKKLDEIHSGKPTPSNVGPGGVLYRC